MGPPGPPQSSPVPWTLMPRPSCRSARGGGTAVAAPSCWGKRRTKVPVGARERAWQVVAGGTGGGMERQWSGRGEPATCSQSWGWGNMLSSANGEHWEVPGRTGCQGRLPVLCTSCQQEPGSALLHSAELRPSLPLSPFCSVKGRRWMEARWQPAPCPGSLLGPAAPRQAENVSEGVSGLLVRREGATCPSLPRHCRTQARTAQSWLCSHVLVCASILQCQPGPAPSCPILPSPARSAELQPVPRSRNQPGGSSGQAAVSWAAQGRSQSPLARGHPWD